MPVVPRLQQSETVVHSLVPSGAILSYAGTAAPTGWLVCDGAPLSTAAYPDLFAALGYTFGGSGATFNLPDLRGRFVRYDDNMGAHGVSGVTAQNAAARDSGRAHGSTQTDAMQGHKHGTTENNHSHGVVGDGTLYADRASLSSAGSGGHRLISNFSNSNPVTAVGTTTGLTVQNPTTDTTNGTPRTAAETRPINIALSAIIKI